MNNPVADWFGPDFARLDPLLQALHRHGGDLHGTVHLTFGTGLAGWIGRRLATRLGLPPAAGPLDFHVRISHQNGALHWSRQFGTLPPLVSVFVPYGHYPDGVWIETTGKLSLELGVNILEGGWYWVQRRLRIKGVPVPLWLFPSTHAYKRITQGQYEFSVSFSLPLLGMLVRYSGLLVPRASVEIAR